MKIEQDIASDEYEDVLARLETLEKATKDMHIGGDLPLGNVSAKGLITGIFRSGEGIKDVDLTGFQMDGGEFVAQASGADKVSIDAATGLITIADGNAIHGGSIDTGTIVAGSITANTITANKFNLAMHYVDGTFTDDSPSAGYVAWADCTVTYDGTTYSIDDGNTDDPIIWWDKSLSTTTFQTAATYPSLDTTDDIIIGWNTSGTFVPLWQTRSVHGENIVADTITASEIAAGTITTTEIAANTIAAANIAANTITAAEIAASTITATEMNVSTLSSMAADLGTITAGSINMFTGTWDSNATGFRLTADEICGQASGADQVLLAASTGKLTAGAGAVTLDEDGIRISEGSNPVNEIKWGTGGGLANIFGAAGTPASLFIRCGRSGSTSGEIELQAYSGAGNAVSLLLNHTTDGSGYLTIDVPRITLDGAVSLGSPTELTISGGEITVTQTNHSVDTQGDAASDDLDTINGGSEGQMLVLRSADSSRDVTVKDATGNIQLDGSADFTLATHRKRIVLMKTGVSWYELSRSDN